MENLTGGTPPVRPLPCVVPCKLYFAEIDTSACNMAEYLIKEMARKQGVTEQLKAEDMMRWVGLMNNIRACADEIVLNDIVYS